MLFRQYSNPGRAWEYHQEAPSTLQASKKMPGNSNDPTLDATTIKCLKNGMRNLNVVGIFLEVGPPTTSTTDGSEMRTCKFADRTACIDLMLTGNEFCPYVQPGDICKITKCYVSNHKNAPALYLGKGGAITKITEFMLIFNESINMSDPSTAAAMATAATAPAGQAPPTTTPQLITNIGPQIITSSGATTVPNDSSNSNSNNNTNNQATPSAQAVKPD